MSLLCTVVRSGESARDGMPAPEGFALIDVVSAGNVSRARNDGAAKADTPWILFVDEDCDVAPATYARVRELLTTGALAQNEVAGATYARQASGNAWSRGYNWIQRAWVTLASDEARAGRSAGNLLGGFLLVPAEIFLRAGGFDENIPWAGEETEFLRRLRARGCAARLLAGLEIGHEKRLSAGGFFRRAWMQGRARGWHRLESHGTDPRSVWARRRELDRITLAEIFVVAAFLLTSKVASAYGFLRTGASIPSIVPKA